VIVFTELVSLTPSPISRYDVADVTEFHVNVSESFVELTNVHEPESSGAKIISIFVMSEYIGVILRRE